MNQDIEKALELKQQLVDFVYDAEGDIAVALETYTANKSKINSYGSKQQSLNIDLFITTEKVNNRSPIEIFIDCQSDLKVREKELLQRWQNSFVGLFEIKAIDKDSYQLVNWLTAKSYRVLAHKNIPEKERKRWQVGEIIVTIIAPLNEREWFFFSDRIIKGQLSKPKLAVAVGEFRDNYPDFLYADAPELLERAWESVAVYHQEFIDYFGSDSLTLPGYQLNQKIQELQQIMKQKKLAEAGIDESKSLADLLAESEVSEAEFAENAENLGADTKTITKVIKQKNKLSMVIPKVDLPENIKQAEIVTVFSDPRWGQMFLPTYEKFTQLLANYNSEDNNSLLQYLRQYLVQPETNYYVWQQLKQTYPQALTELLAEYTNQKDFNLELDLDSLLREHHKLPIPQLPSIASVPLHLNNLFETALAQVQKTKSKKKKKRKKGFLK